MRLWAEERRNGSIELLLTLPIPLTAVVIGKYLAALAFSALALALTFPIWLTVNYLGEPDNVVSFSPPMSVRSCWPAAISPLVRACRH